MSIMAKTPSGYKKIGSAYLGERPVDKVFNANGDVVYALQRELTGVPPLLFKGKEQSNLSNYRIYGDTVGGESVGDLVESGEHAGEYKVPVTVEGKNLLDETHNTIPLAILDDGAIEAGDGYLIYAPINPLQTYTFRTNGTIRFNLRSAFTINEPAVAGSYLIDGVDTHINHGKNKEFTRQAPLNANWIVIQIRDESALAYDNMLVEGSTPLPFEPYHAPVTTPIYLPEPIKMVGDEAEYIDYAEQKLHRVRKNLFDETIYNINVADNTIIYVPMYVGNVGYVTCSTACPKTGDSVYDVNNSRYIFFISGSVNAGAQNTANGVYNGAPRTIRPSNGYVTIAYRKIESYNIRPWEYQTMLNVGSTALPYEPYIENTEVDVILPVLPIIKGTNTMSVDTEVQPSRMDIKGRIKSLT